MKASEAIKDMQSRIPSPDAGQPEVIYVPIEAVYNILRGINSGEIENDIKEATC